MLLYTCTTVWLVGLAPFILLLFDLNHVESNLGKSIENRWWRRDVAKQKACDIVMHEAWPHVYALWIFARHEHPYVGDSTTCVLVHCTWSSGAWCMTPGCQCMMSKCHNVRCQDAPSAWVPGCTEFVEIWMMYRRHDGRAIRQVIMNHRSNVQSLYRSFI